MKPDFLLASLEAEACAEPEDAIKFLYQNAFGCGHLLLGTAACAEAIRREMEQARPNADAPAFKPLGNGLCRLNLRCPAVRALPAERIAHMMQLTAERFHGSDKRFADNIRLLRSLTARFGADVTEPAQRRLPFTAEAMEAALGRYTGGLPRHSARYHKAYAPAYRVVLRRYGEALPLLTQLEANLAADGRATLVLDGDCASGKTTLAALLSPLYDCNVFHMDDFFLPFAMRTPGRMAEPGGNVHYERFRDQVLTGLLSGGSLSYGAFDCHTGETRTMAVPPKPVTIIEGSYALHPAFYDAYHALHAVRVRLTVEAEEQRGRILARNGPAMLRRFQNEWIPLEKRYFQAYHRAREDQTTLPSHLHDEDIPETEEQKP